VLGTLSTAWSALMPKDDDQLGDELARSFLSYLDSDGRLGKVPRSKP